MHERVIVVNLSVSLSVCLSVCLCVTFKPFWGISEWNFGRTCSDLCRPAQSLNFLARELLTRELLVHGTPLAKLSSASRSCKLAAIAFFLKNSESVY